MKEAAEVIKELLLRECKRGSPSSKVNCCIVTASSTVWRLSSIFPESYIVANSAVQVFPNITSVYYAVEKLSVPLVAITGSTSLNLEELVSFEFQASEVEFKLLKKIYEENAEIIFPLYEESEETKRAALMEINIDVQIEKLLSINEFSEKIKEGKLTLCGLVLDEDNVYGKEVGFYLTNLNGAKDPEEIKGNPILSSLSPAIKEEKVRRIHLQF